jgi:hypothetical protein
VRRAATVIAVVIGVYVVATKSGRRRLKRAREVYFKEVRSGSKPIEAVGTAVAGFVGLAEGGPLRR